MYLSTAVWVEGVLLKGQVEGDMAQDMKRCAKRGEGEGSVS